MHVKRIRAVVVSIAVGGAIMLALPANAGFFSTRFGDFKELVEAGKIEDAAALYAKEAAYFSGLKDDKRKFVDDVLAQRDSRYGAELTAARVWLILAGREEGLVPRWQRLKQVLPEIDTLLSKDKELPAPGPRTTDGMAQLAAASNRVKTTLADEAPQALIDYGLFTEPSFHSQYPVAVAWSRFSTIAAPVEELLSKASLQQLVSFKKTYGDTLIPALGLAPKLTEFYVAGRLREAGARSYLAKRLIRERLAKQGWPQAGGSDAGVLLAAWPAPKSEVSSYRVTPPTVIGYMQLDAAQTPGEVVKSFAAGKRDLIVFVRPSPIRLERNESNVRQVSSQYQTGTRRVANPAYAEAQRALAKARQDLADVQRAAANASTGDDSTLGMLAAVVSGVSQAAAESSVSDARRTLETTPSVIDEPVFATYAYTAKTIAVKQSVTSHYAVYDPGTGQTTTGTIDRNYSKTFSVADAVRADDPSRGAIMKNAKAPQDVESWINSEFVDKTDAIWAAILADYKAKNMGI